MIHGVHALIYCQDADRARAFLRNTLGLQAVDAGEGWLIFALPPAELGVHPAEGNAGEHRFYFMCDDIQATMRDLKAKGVEFSSPVEDQGWGLLTAMKIPGGGELPLYQPRHRTAIPGPKA